MFLVSHRKPCVRGHKHYYNYKIACFCKATNWMRELRNLSAPTKSPWRWCKIYFCFVTSSLIRYPMTVWIGLYKEASEFQICKIQIGIIIQDSLRIYTPLQYPTNMTDGQPRIRKCHCTTLCVYNK